MAGYLRRHPYVVLFLAFVILASGLYFAKQAGSDRSTYSNDFNVYYFASGEVLTGGDPYRRSVTERAPYLYLPLLAELLVPLAVLSLPLAAYVWFVINAVATLSALWMSARLATEGNRFAAGLFHGGGSLFHPGGLIVLGTFAVLARFALDNFQLGQVNAVICMLAAAHVYLYARGRTGLAAFVLSLAGAIKLTPMLLIFYHLAKGRWKFTIGCCVLFVFLSALSFAPFGSESPEVFRAFFARTVQNGQGFDMAYSGNQSLRGLLGRVAGEAGEHPRNPSAPGVMIAAVCLLALACASARRANTEVAAAAPFFCCIALLAPVAWKAHFIILILPVAFLISEAVARANARDGRLILGVCIAAGFLFNFTSLAVIGRPAAEWADALSLVTSGTLLIYSCCVGVVLGTAGMAVKVRKT